MTMKLVIAIIVLIHTAYCTRLPHRYHNCTNGTSEELAGWGSGTISFNGGSCELLLTGIKAWLYYKLNMLNIVGAIASRKIPGNTYPYPCPSKEIFIDTERLCIDEKVTDTLIHVRYKQVKFAVVSDQKEAFTLRYYKGMRISRKIRAKEPFIFTITDVFFIILQFTHGAVEIM